MQLSKKSYKTTNREMKMKIKQNHKAFTLIELLVVISIIALLVAMLMPGLQKAKSLSYQIVCSSNVSGISKALTMLSASRDDKYPAAYTYSDTNPDVYTQSNISLTESGQNIISHWSYELLKRKIISSEQLDCPAFARDGLPPRSTTLDNLEEGQISYIDDQQDLQAKRCSYTVNEALFPRNRFESNFEGAIRKSRYVSSSEVKNTANTIMVTEWATNWEIVSESGDGICDSYLPVHGVKALGSDNHNDLNSVPIQPGKPCFRGGIFERRIESELSLWQSTERINPSRLDWVGRNHGTRHSSATRDERNSCFAYVDGHVECKSIFATISDDFEWGDRIYSIASKNNKVKQ